MITLAFQNAAPEVSIHDGKVVTTSMAVAEYFHKRHDDVIKKIRAVMTDCEPEYHARNFAEMVREVVVGDGAIRKSPYFELTRDAFVLLVMGFTGKRALQWKIRYIEAFNAMEAELLQRSSSPTQTEINAVSDDYANRTEMIYYQNFKPVLGRILNPGEVVMSHDEIGAWLEKKGLILFTREELRELTYEQWLMICR
ncbi:Rha family transcriptional regulator [Enterobacter kobei]|nr:Rha family transcriptional regulator [Enterobacter kobei]